MKRIIFASVLLLSFAFSATAAITEKVLKAFNETFHNAKEVQWHEYESAYQVNFLHNEIATSVVYDKEGNILEARRHSKEDILPLIIREKLKRRFEDKQVWGVTELTQRGQTSYRIVLHDAKKWVILDSDSNGVLFVREKFDKG
ncbi:MAG TPA: hypothetical protein VGE66_13715 [Chitinophagaceae bacterium]